MSDSLSKKAESEQPPSKGAFEPLLSFVNGFEQTSVSVSDRGLSFGDGVFETLLLVKGQPFLLAQHLDRLQLGLDRLQIPAKRKIINQQFENFLATAKSKDLNNGIVKLLVSRGGGRGYAPNKNSEPTVIFCLYPLADWSRQQRQGVATIFCQHRLPKQAALAGIKHLNRLDQVIASLEIQNQNVEEGLLLDDQDQVIEAISRNIFVVLNQQLLSPKMDHAGVKGVMRDYIISTLAPAASIPVTEVVLHKQDIYAADEVFVCNSVTGIWPLVRIDNHAKSVGPITKQLQQYLDQQVLL